MPLSLIPPTLPPPFFHHHHHHHHHHHTLNPLYLTFHPKPHQKFICRTSKNPRKNPKKLTDSDLTSEFSAQVDKINTQLEEKQNALIKTKQMLFSDFSNFLNSNPNQVKINWIKMNPDEKLGLVKGFVSHWGLNFHPLSPKSVRDLIDEFVMKDCVKNSEISDSDSGLDLSRLKKLIMGGLSRPDY